MNVTSCNKRRNDIMEALIGSYIRHAKPISSKFLKQEYKFSISSATIRNVMSDLEEKDYIMQPHTSSGRIPTDKGYRFYIDSLMKKEDFSLKQKKRLKNSLSLTLTAEDLINKVSEILAFASYEAAINLYFNFKESLLRYIDLVNVGSNRILLIIVTDSGLIRNCVVQAKKPFDDEDLKKISNFLNANLKNVSLSKIKSKLQQYLEKEDSKIRNIIKKATEIFDNDDIFNNEYELYHDGTQYILKKPEFKDIKKLSRVLDVLEDEKVMFKILKNSYKPTYKKVKVQIGQENKFEKIQECSLVTSCYKIADKTVGILGLLGPTRMAYPRIMSLMEYISECLSEILTENVLGHKKDEYDE
jgi:heat-inducible transcriptional repressor